MNEHYNSTLGEHNLEKFDSSPQSVGEDGV
jgi:hypothetical protein